WVVSWRVRQVCPGRRVGEYQRVRRLDPSRRYRQVIREELGQCRLLVVPGDQPEDLVGAGESLVGERHALAGLVSARGRDKVIGDVQYRIAGYQGRGVPVGAETEMDQVKMLRQESTVPGRGFGRVRVVDRHRDHLGRPLAEALPQVREIAVGVRGRRDAL